MRQESKNSSLVLGVLLALVSLPLTWISLRDFAIQPYATGMFFGGMTINADVSALTGNIFQVPLWTAVLVCIVSHISQLMDASSFFIVPKLVTWALAISAAAMVSVAIVYPLFHGGVTPGIGAFVGLLSSGIAVAMLALPATNAGPLE